MPRTVTCPRGHQWPLAEDRPAAGGAAVACPVCGAAPDLEALGAPPPVAAALGRLRDELTRRAGDNLAGLVLFGGLARGRFRPGRSDVNVVVLLRDLSAPVLAAVSPALRAAWRAARVEPLLLTPAEVRRATEAFATKFLDIQAHHLVLCGEDPFVGLEVQREHLRLRIEQALRNLLLRLRRRYVALGDEPDQLRDVLRDVARPLALELEGLLRLTGRAVPAEDRTAAVFEAAAAAYKLDGQALARLAALRQADDAATAEDVTALFPLVLEAVQRTVQVVDQLEESAA